MAEEFKILDARDHARLRMGVYIGSSSVEQIDRFILGKWKTVIYVPALVKAVDEIIDNSIDEAIRTNFKHANRISVSLTSDSVKVSDNGRGIPQDIVKDSNSKEMLRPVAAWTKTNAGTSFTEDRVTIGANGLGSAIVNFVSKKFVGLTGNGKTLVEVDCLDGANSVRVSQNESNHKGTTVEFWPDFSLFEVESFDEFELKDIVLDRLTSLSVSFPQIRFFLNEKDVSSTIKKHAFHYIEQDCVDVVSQSSTDLDMFFVASSDGYRTNSYVNGVNTRHGGSYVDMIVSGVVEELAVLIKKKFKVDVVKSVIKNGLTFVMFARNFKGPKFDSQTKERLTNSAKEILEHFASTKFETAKIAKLLIASEEIITPIISAQIAKKEAEEAKAAKALQSKAKKLKVAKHVQANKPGGILFLMEGESALGFGISVRDPNKHGFYPLKGVSMNSWTCTQSEVLKNKEFADIVGILGLDIRDPLSYKTMPYETIGIATDADHDGSGHIAPLLAGFFYRFWPGMFENERIALVRTPIQISAKGKDSKWFFDYESAMSFKESSKGYVHRYLKGLASLKKEEYRKIINEPILDFLHIDDPSVFGMMLGDDSQARKDFITQ